MADGEEGDWTLHGILSPEDPIAAGMWYVIPTENDAGHPEGGPGQRLGHACACIEEERAMYIFHGASPEGTLEDVARLDLDTYRWTRVKAKGTAPCGRYEHCALWREGTSRIFLVFGAEQERNLNDIYIFDFKANEWTKPALKGATPTPRTLHSAAIVKHQIFVFGGGDIGMSPVADTKVHILDTDTLQWTQAKTSGPVPSARLGHTCCVVGTDIFVYGGMAGTDVFGDMFKLDTTTLTWSNVVCKGDVPSARSGHAACAIGTTMFMSGGLGITPEGPVTNDDIYAFDTATSSWKKLSLQSAPLSARLDHTMVAASFGGLSAALAASHIKEHATAATAAASAIHDVTGMFGIGDARSPAAAALPIPTEAAANSTLDQAAQDAGTAHAKAGKKEEQEQEDKALAVSAAGAVAAAPVPRPDQCLLVFGGMDTLGNIYNDCLLLKP